MTFKISSFCCVGVVATTDGLGVGVVDTSDGFGVSSLVCDPDLDMVETYRYGLFVSSIVTFVKFLQWGYEIREHLIYRLVWISDPHCI